MEDITWPIANSAVMAYESDGMQLALKHYQFAASTGFKDAVDRVQKMYDNDLVGKDDFTAVLRDYQTAFIKQRSDERVKWAEKEKEKEEKKKQTKYV